MMTETVRLSQRLWRAIDARLSDAADADTLWAKLRLAHVWDGKRHYQRTIVLNVAERRLLADVLHHPDAYLSALLAHESMTNHWWLGKENP